MYLIRNSILRELSLSSVHSPGICRKISDDWQQYSSDQYGGCVIINPHGKK